MQQEFGVDVSRIERELGDLWKQMSESALEEGQHPVMRACVLNLVVYAPGEGSEAVVSQIMSEVTNENPGRIIVLLPDAGGEAARMSAWVNAQCHFAPGGRKQVCCEQIVIRAEGNAIQQLPSITMPLLVPDLPVFLWWRDAVPARNEIFQDLMDTSDRVVLDSATFVDPLEGFRWLSDRMDQQKEWTAFSDLDWSRLTPWRMAISEFFDIRECRPHLDKLSRVEIEWSGNNMQAIPGQALLVGSWMATALKWKHGTKFKKSENDRYGCELISDYGTISFQISVTSSAGTPPGLRCVKLAVDGEPSAEFKVVAAEDAAYLQTSVKLGGRECAKKVATKISRTEAELIRKELEILGHDMIYEKAVEFIASL